MRKRNIYLLLLAGAALALVLPVVFNRERETEPEYGGKRLSEWLMQNSKSPPGAEKQEASNAICQIAPAAVPYLLKWMNYETPAWKSTLYRDVNPMLGRLKPSWQFNADPKFALAGGASSAFYELGPEVEGVLPALTKLLLSRRVSLLGAARVAGAIANRGNAGLSRLLELLADSHCDTRVKPFVVSAIGSFGTKAWAAIPALQPLLKHPDVRIRTAAINALLQIDGYE